MSEQKNTPQPGVKQGHVHVPHLHLPHFHLPHVKIPHIHWPHFHVHFHDRPLSGEPHPDRPLHWRLYWCEALATAVLMIAGLTCVILLTAPGTYFAGLLAPHPVIQTALCGLCFGLAGTVAAMTPFGKVSGAHLNPSVTLAFMLSKKIVWIDALGYIIAQIIGATLGTAAVYAVGAIFAPWHLFSTEVNYGATIPYTHISIWYALASETLVTGLLIVTLYWLAAHPRYKWITPWIGGVFFLIMNPITAWLSGNSANFARTFGPDLFAGNWSGLWIYLIGPFIGSSLAVWALQADVFGKLHLLEARLVNFGHHGRVPHLEDPDFKHAAPEHYDAYRTHLEDLHKKQRTAPGDIAAPESAS
ncbi:MIP/aquaporin family protein [Acetobacter oeni]|nr:aquaporin [Acetobacter oeni]MBB3884159.1 aquaporin Z [Acetobacter oeni]NHO20161.1 porin [Acetobacter oeni]